MRATASRHSASRIRIGIPSLPPIGDRRLLDKPPFCLLSSFLHLRRITCVSRNFSVWCQRWRCRCCCWAAKSRLCGVCRRRGEVFVAQPSVVCLAQTSPKIYGPNEWCVMHVHESGILHVELFHTSSDRDSLIVGDRKLTGDIGSMMISVNPDTTIEWTSNSLGGSGWHACLEPPTPAPPSVWTLTAERGGVCRTTERCVSSPNFPPNLPPQRMVRHARERERDLAHRVIRHPCERRLFECWRFQFGWRHWARNVACQP